MFFIKLKEINYIQVRAVAKELTQLFKNHCLRSVRIRGYSAPYFPAIGLNTDTFYAVNSHEKTKITIEIILKRSLFYSQKIWPEPCGGAFQFSNCRANQLTGFYMRATLAFNRLNESFAAIMGSNLLLFLFDWKLVKIK